MPEFRKETEHRPEENQHVPEKSRETIKTILDEMFVKVVAFGVKKLKIG